MNAGTLDIFQYKSGIPSDIKVEEYTTWANMTPDGLECQEITSWKGFEEEHPKFLPFKMKFTR